MCYAMEGPPAKGLFVGSAGDGGAAGGEHRRKRIGAMDVMMRCDDEM